MWGRWSSGFLDLVQADQHHPVPQSTPGPAGTMIVELLLHCFDLYTYHVREKEGVAASTCDLKASLTGQFPTDPRRNSACLTNKVMMTCMFTIYTQKYQFN